MLSLTAGLMFHALALGTAMPPTNDIKDTDLPNWCPPSNDPGLAVICGTVVSSSVQEVYKGIQQANAPVDDILVAAYEENIISPTGKLSGKLTNIFSSTSTNKLGRYRITVRRVKPPKLKVHLVFFCGASVAQEIVVDSWHNTWGLFTQVDCKRKPKPKPTTPSVEGAPPPHVQPPFPLKPIASAASFLGCTNEHLTDTAIGLAKHEEPVINTIINENNYDHRFNMNSITMSTGIPYFYFTPFTSPGGLWEPDCLLRNEEGTYQCNALACNYWEAHGLLQPCTGSGAKQCGITPGYTGAKVYAAGSCTPDPNTLNADGTLTTEAEEFVEACKQKNAEGLAAYIAANGELPKDPIDGVLCDVQLDSGEGVPMAKDDYITRPFFKYIPKGPVEYEAPFRRFEYRNNLQNYAVDPYAPMQWINTYIGSAANSGSGVPIATFRAFTGAVSTDPDVPNCAALYDRNMPFQDQYKPVTQNRLINAGYITALAEPFGALDETYYSGQKDLSAYVCQKNDGELIRVCDIQVPWGEGALCEIHKPGCKDTELTPKLQKTLSRLNSAGTLVDPTTAAQITVNVNSMLASCGHDFKLSKLYFPPDLIFKAGNTQMGLHSDTPNDSIPAYAERREEFIPAESEQEAEALTGSRIVFQGGGNFMANSYNTILCALNPKVCNNNKNANSLTEVFTAPYTTSYEDVKKRYLDDTIWEVDSLGPGQSSMCSISNVYNVDIRGPEEEVAGVPSLGLDPGGQADAEGGYFDQLFKSNSQHKNELSAGTATWYMSENAVLRDKEMMTLEGLAGFLNTKFWGSGNPLSGEDGTRSVGTSSHLINYAFASLIGRDVWDSMLTLAGGDASVHDLNFHLPDILGQILNSLAAETPWKSYGDRQQGSGNPVVPSEKPYYPVTFEYPLTEITFKEKFKLPGLTENEDGTTTYDDTVPLLPEDWGPGHVCYGFDTQVLPGQVCGTYREAPEGVSRTCRLDKCVAFTRVETATCSCTRQVISMGPPRILGDPEDADCAIFGREDRNLIIRDCSRENRLMCANLQETSRAWQECPDGYEKKHPPADVVGPCDRDEHGKCKTCYFRDGRSGQETSGNILPPDDIDITLEKNDQLDHYNGYQDPPEIPDVEALCNPSMFTWPYDKKTQAMGLIGPESNVRPRCWVSAAGPFRKYPNFSAVGQSVPQPARKATGQQIKNCNGYIKIVDSALRAKQTAPYAAEGQIQQNLDESTIIGIKILKTFLPPYAPAWGGTKMALIDSKETNNGLVDAEGVPTDFYTRGQMMSMGGVGDVSTLRMFFSPPPLVIIAGNEGELRSLYYHCDYQTSHVLDTHNEKQQEYFDMMSGYDPDLDGTGGWICPIVLSPDPQVPNIENKPGNCGVTDFKGCEDLLKQVWTNTVISRTNMTEIEKSTKLTEIQGWHFAKTFQNAINWAAYQSNTPGGALMTVMFLEGGLDIQYMKNWSDNIWVHNAGAPWFGQMDLGGPASCNDLVWTAQGPFQLIKHWVECLVDPTSLACSGGKGASESSKQTSLRFCASLNKAGFGRCESVLNAGRCNLIDAAMITAYFMNPEAGMTPGSCEDFDLNTALQLFSGGSYMLEGGQNLLDTANQIYEACR